jgi:predicted sulfurtransferase
MSVVVAALYHFADFHDCAAWRERLLAWGNEHGIKGTMVVALEVYCVLQSLSLSVSMYVSLLVLLLCAMLC